MGVDFPGQHFSARMTNPSCYLLQYSMIQVLPWTLDIVIKLIFLPQESLNIALPLPWTNAYSRISCMHL